MVQDAERYARLYEIIAGANGLLGEALHAYVDAACAGDAGLCSEALELLAEGRDEEKHDAFSEGNIEGARLALQSLADGAVSTWLPKKIGDYTIVRQIGQGGMGIVYEAIQKSPRRSVAIKLLHNGHATPDRLRRFRREAEVLGRLRHPGIAQIFEGGTYDVGRGPQPFIAMELVHGTDIRTHVEKEGLDLRARAELLARVADAVQYAHDHGVVHRDLKPDNVIVNRHHRPVILDFGIARTLDAAGAVSTVLTEEGQLVGTLAYMAPEQLTQPTTSLTPKVDVYALGVMGFELFVGRLPYSVEDMPISEVIARLTAGNPPRAATLDRNLKGDLDTILGKALESDPGRRYEIPAALAGDLRRHLAHEPIRARPPSNFYLVGKFVRRHRGLTLGVAMTLITLMAGITVALVLARQAGEQRDLARANENRAINGLLQSAQVLIDAGRERDAVTQLRLVPEASRGLAWRLLDRAVPLVIDQPVGAWRFVDDDTVVGLVGERVVLYSLLDHRVIGERFGDMGIAWLGRVSKTGVVPARSEREAFLLDFERGTVLWRSPLYHARQDPPEVVPRVATREPEVSEDGRTVLRYTSESDAEILVDGEVVRTLGDLTVFDTLCLGVDGGALAVNRPGSVTVLDVATGRERFRHTITPGSQARGYPVRGGVLLSNRREFPLGEVRPTKWQRIPLGEVPPTSEHGDPFGKALERHVNQDASFSRDGRVLALTRVDGAFLVNPDSGAALEFPKTTAETQGTRGFLPFSNRKTGTVAVSPSGRRVLIFGGWSEATLVELDPTSDRDTDRGVRTLRGHLGPGGVFGGWIYHVTVSNDGSLLASAAPDDPNVCVWDARTGSCLATLERSCSNPGSRDALLAFTPDDERLLVTTPFRGSKTPRVVEWNLLTSESRACSEATTGGGQHLELIDRFLEVLRPNSGARLSQRVQMRGDRALAGFYRVLSEFERPSEGSQWRFVPLEGSVTGLSVHPRLQQVAVVRNRAERSDGIGVAREGRLTILDPTSGKILVERELAWHPWCVAYDPKGSALAIGTDEGSVLLFETERYTQQLEWRAHDGESYSYVYSLAWTPDGTRLVTASGDATLRIWDTRTRVASRRADDRWRTLQEEMAGRADVRDIYGSLEGDRREAARIELIRRAHPR